MYDVVRIIDPVEKRILEYKDSDISTTGCNCYDFWKRGKICDNCTSIRANIDNKCYIKLEPRDNQIMMVTSIPVEGAKRPTVVELIKNVTNSMMVGTGDLEKEHTLFDIMGEIGSLITKDEATGLFNKKYASERLPADIVRASLESRPFSILFLDLDDFKQINDTYGHLLGDELIKRTADVLRKYEKETWNWAARYGGDEFILYLDNTGYDAACHIAEALRKDIEVLTLKSKGEYIHTTVSVGVYTFHNEQKTAEEIIALADERMYQAKKTGKNQWIGIKDISA